MKGPTIYIAQDPHGLWLPATARGLPEPPNRRIQRLVPRELWPKPSFRALHRQRDDEIPEGQDFIYAAPSPADLGLPNADLGNIVELLAEMPFLPAMRALSLLSAAVYHAHENVDSHRRLAAAFYRGDLRQKVMAFLDDGDHHLAFDSRQISALQRLVVLHAADVGDGDGLDENHQRRLMLALLAMGSALPHGEPPDVSVDGPVDVEAWTRYVVQVGLYYERPWIAETMARSWSSYVTVANDLRDRSQSCPIDEWLRSDVGFTLAEQVAVGMAYGQGSGAFEPTLSLEERSARRPVPGFLAGTAMASREEHAVALISADREELRALLEEPGLSPMQLGWDHTAFEAKPFLRGADGSLLLHSPTALMSWMTRGVHYRALDAANRRRNANGKKLGTRWLAHAGSLGEESVRRLLRGSVPTGKPIVTVLHGEIEYRGAGGRQDSPDAAIESWPHLALFEVYSGRFSREARSSGDAEPLMRALRRATVAKLHEVLDRANDVLEGRLVYPEAVAPPTTIWPVVVLAGDGVTLWPIFWEWLRKEMDGRLDADPRIRRPIIVDRDDLEPLLALVEQGRSIFELLGRFLSSSLAEFALRNWLAREFDLGGPLRPRYVREQWALAARAGAGALYPGSETLARAIEAEII